MQDVQDQEKRQGLITQLKDELSDLMHRSIQLETKEKVAKKLSQTPGAVNKDSMFEQMKQTIQ